MGLAVGIVVYTLSGKRPRADTRRRTMSDAAALGYRVGLGENPVTLQMR